MEISFPDDNIANTACEAAQTSHKTNAPSVCELESRNNPEECHPCDEEMPEHFAMWTAPDGSLSKLILKRGSGFTTPNDGTPCRVTMTCANTHGSSIEEQLDVGYPTGEQTDIVLGDGCGRLSEVVDACLETMHAGEECRLSILDRNATANSKFSLGDELKERDAMPCLCITLHSFTRNKDIFEMSVADILARVSQLKAYGTRCFKESQLQRAEQFYIRALRYIVSVCHPKDVQELDEAERQEYQALKRTCSLNLAACQLKQKRYRDVIIHCSCALENDPTNAKALYRRCRAYLALDEFESARTDIQTALSCEPRSKLFLEQHKLLVKREKQVYNKLSLAMNKMFGGPS